MNTRDATLLGTSIAALAFLALLLVPATGTAQGKGTGGNFGLGLGKGTLASGITGKYYMSADTALQGHLGYTPGWGWGRCERGPYDYDCRGYYGFGLNIDYMYTFSNLVEGGAGRLFASGGGGGAISSSGPFGGGAIAVNGVLELGFHFNEVPIELVADWRPFFAFGGAPLPGFFDFGFSARFYF